MIVTFLGTGTSDGIPLIGCECEVCRSPNPKNKRTRSSILIQYDQKNIMVDTTPEMRIQLLTYAPLKHLEAILFTHAHADHIHGLNDVRIFNKRTSHTPIPCYGNRVAVEEIRSQFQYIFNETQQGGGKPRIELTEINSPFDLFGHMVIPLPVKHGKIDILGFRIENFAYITDASLIPKKTIELIRDLDTLVINALRYVPHSTHLSLDQSLEIIREVAPRQAFLTHLSHKLEHDSVAKILPPNAQPAFDGLRIEL